MRQDAHLADRGVLSIRQRFIKAMRTDPTDLNPDVLYPIIDATTVKRTRQFVKKHYSGDTIKGPDGTPRAITFPKPNAITVRYALEDQLPGFFDQLEESLDSDGDKNILFARYMPGAYRIESPDQEENGHARAMTGLLRSGLLKRFESSCFAFRETIQKMILQHDHFLQAIEKGHVVTTAFLQDISGDDESLFEELLERHSEDIADVRYFDVTRLKNDVLRDRDRLQTLEDSAASISNESDAKLTALSNVLVEIAAQAEYEASDAIDETQKRKVLIFSSFADTVKWIWGFLNEELEKRPELAAYQGRLTAVSGSYTRLARFPRMMPSWDLLPSPCRRAKMQTQIDMISWSPRISLPRALTCNSVDTLSITMYHGIQCDWYSDMAESTESTVPTVGYLCELFSQPTGLTNS